MNLSRNQANYYACLEEEKVGEGNLGIPTNEENGEGEKQRKKLRTKAAHHFKKHLNFSSNGESGQGKFWGFLPIEKVKKWRSHILSQQHQT